MGRDEQGAIRVLSAHHAVVDGDHRVRRQPERCRNLPPRTPCACTVKAQFEGATGTCKRLELRPCKLRVAKQ